MYRQSLAELQSLQRSPLAVTPCRELQLIMGSHKVLMCCHVMPPQTTGIAGVLPLQVTGKTSLLTG